MDNRAPDTRESLTTGNNRGTDSALQEEAWISRRPESITSQISQDRDRWDREISDKLKNAETPEVKAAYKAMLAKTRGIDPVAVADSLILFGDLASSSKSVPEARDSLQIDNSLDMRPGPEQGASPEQPVEPRIAQAYNRLLQRGLNSVLIIDVLTICGDVAAIATSPQGRKLFEDIKLLTRHLRG
jgi:hypothetical protein